MDEGMERGTDGEMDGWREGPQTPLWLEVEFHHHEHGLGKRQEKPFSDASRYEP